ncbi:NADPH:quinone oxidoreductase [Sorangium cellulosum]|uniref:NADPH:quinone oxidoreductase n=1 Tax=Sorangium cellulosum TaxID=56 RepID=A0A2L0EL48_SORCE|nr:NAD(P)-dependent alcohol dehydrogenase [Sorangium cellulosum]AUX39982.1 NADPH:quinone oxidoreductase [Sorangium cellulosum]
MKAWIVEGKFGIASLKLAEREAPRPRAGEVLVRVRAASINYRDLMVIDGVYNPTQPLPFIPVSDGAGEVVAVGEGVARVRVGDRVAGAFIQGWPGGRGAPEVMLGSTLGSPRDGVLAEYALFDEGGAVVLPKHLSFEEASTLPIAGVTAWRALFVDAAVRAGDTVLVQGTGGVAVFAIQLARAAGARVIVTSSSDEKLARAREIGAHDTINYKATPAWDERALELTGGVGADVVVDVAGSTLPRSLNALRPGGQVSLIGLLAGATAQVDVVRMLQKKARIQGIYVGSREDFDDLNRALVQHRIRPVVDRAYSFEEAPAAIEALRGAAHFGKLVIRGA